MQWIISMVHLPRLTAKHEGAFNYPHGFLNFFILFGWNPAFDIVTEQQVVFDVSIIRTLSDIEAMDGYMVSNIRAIKFSALSGSPAKVRLRQMLQWDDLPTQQFW